MNFLSLEYLNLDLTPFETIALWGVLLVALLGLLYAIFLRNQVLRHDKGTPLMQEVWAAIKEGADAYLTKQLRTILPFIVILTIALFFSVYIVPPTAEARERFPTLSEDQLQMFIGLGRAVAFIMGAGFSLMVGQIGMRMAVQANVRVAAESRKSFGGALQIAYRAGTITGMLTDGLGLFGGTIIFMIFGLASPDVLLGFGFGGTLVALFMRVGGGIFTKAADVGADLVGKVEQDIPEDDPRNAAVIADLVGDNVGDCAGMAADLFESYAVTLVASLILGRAALGEQGMILPLLVTAIGALVAVLGVLTTRVRGTEDGLKAIYRGFAIAAVVGLVLATVVCYVYLPATFDSLVGTAVGGGTGPVAELLAGRGVLADPRFVTSAAVGVGVVLAGVILALTGYFTSTNTRPTRTVAATAQTGPATVVLSGIGVGLESAVHTAGIIAAAICVCFLLAGGSVWLSLFLVALAGCGLLTTVGVIVAMDTFGPVSDNAQGIAEMSGDVDEAGARTLTDLDAVGNTTKAITKGIAIATAVLAATALFGSYADAVSGARALADGSAGAATDGLAAAMLSYQVVSPVTLVGIILGGATVFLFSGMAIDAVTRAAGAIVQEVRRQFREMPGIMTYEQRPEYGRVVDICTRDSLSELATPGLLAASAPVAVGFGLGVGPLAGFLAGAIGTGVLMAVFLANSGGSWDNAKKLVEDGAYGGKGSDAHAATVIGDTVGDPFKDTAGPAINPLIKVMNLVAVLVAPAVVAVTSDGDLATQVPRLALAMAAAAVAFGAILRARHRAKTQVLAMD